MSYRTAAQRDATALGHEIDILADDGANAYLTALVLLCPSVHACGPYRVGAVRLRARCAHIHNPLTSAFRGFGGMQVVFAYESQMNRLAQRLGLGPAELRKRNAVVRGDDMGAVGIVANRAVSAIGRGTITTSCVFTGAEQEEPADAVVLVTAWLP